VKLNSRDWPAWYLRQNLLAGTEMAQGMDDERLVRWWRALHVAAPGNNPISIHRNEVVHQP
jgi:hypothetical protein